MPAPLSRRLAVRAVRHHAPLGISRRLAPGDPLPCAVMVGAVSARAVPALRRL